MSSSGLWLVNGVGERKSRALLSSFPAPQKRIASLLPPPFSWRSNWMQRSRGCEGTAARRSCGARRRAS
eukprot:15458732-Alexandrium_andersonii.AAC.1